MVLRGVAGKTLLDERGGFRIASVKDRKDISLWFVERINELSVRIMRLPDVESKFREVGIDIIGGTPAEALTFLQRDTERWTKIVRAVGAKAD